MVVISRRLSELTLIIYTAGSMHEKVAHGSIMNVMQQPSMHIQK